MNGNKVEQCLLKGHIAQSLKVSPYIRTLLITTSILTTYPIFTCHTSESQWTWRSYSDGFQEFINRQQERVRYLGNEQAKHTTSPLTDSHLLLHTTPLDSHTSPNKVFTAPCSTIETISFCHEHLQTSCLLMSRMYQSPFEAMLASIYVALLDYNVERRTVETVFTTFKCLFRTTQELFILIHSSPLK